jgi:AhpC/TSA family
MRGCTLLVLLLALPARSEEVLRFVDRGGQPVEIRPEAVQSGPAVVLHFWATWCPECIDDLARVSTAFTGCERVSAYAVDAGESAPEVEAFVKSHPIGLPVLRDPTGEAWRRLDGRGLPMNAWWSAAGAKTDLGPKTREQWRAFAASLGCP